MTVGACAEDILRQFLAESLILCLRGGGAGILLGHGASLAVTMILRWKTIPSLPAIVVAFAVSASIGIIFGYYPTWKASRLDPIEALRLRVAVKPRNSAMSRMVQHARSFNRIIHRL
jgi:ABC-type antimicrobial peptide transport system permease subunit